MPELKDKLKELRTAHHMTQETAAEQLGVSSQTVSKWERGLLSPDIALLPKIAILYKCSIDSLFDMDSIWGTEHRRAFEAKMHTLYAKRDWEGIFEAWIQEIERNPDCYENYPEVMRHVLRKKLFDTQYIEKMLSLANRAEKCCTDDDIRSEINRMMLQICSESDDPTIKEKGKSYYQKLPMLRHSREVYARFVMDGEEYRAQMRKNIIYLIDLAECSVRQLITPDMPPEEKLFYYQKAAALYETVADGKYAGFYDPPLLTDYCEIASLYTKLGRPEKAAEYVHRILAAIERHLIESEKETVSKLLDTAVPPHTPSPVRLCEQLMRRMLAAPDFLPYTEEIQSMLKRFEQENRSGRAI